MCDASLRSRTPTRAGSEPLNATLAGSLTGSEPAYVGVALAAAEYNAAAGTVAYQVVVLAEEEGPAQVAATTLVGPAEQQVFGPGHLFIDSGCAKGCGVTFIGCCCESDPLDCALANHCLELPGIAGRFSSSVTYG